ncbi:class I SAM-dependent DNA methyltransferase [Streptomyces anulatus]|uniref:class I SAM-dependent DNA methyltransferase n=1 Tax=Streptomyces anulatus TaxID=1892 RepID=UPI001C279C7B|nr:class I SAM-dependent methyltransferase [Streptomyces anulatus]
MRPYEALAEVYDRWTAGNDYAGWAAHLRGAFAELEPEARLLDVCCGTGKLTALLEGQGFRVTGVDASQAMLKEAAAALPPGTPLHRVGLGTAGPAEELASRVGPAAHDAAVCTFDSVNYFLGEGLLRLFEQVAGALRPGGLFVFDVNTRRKLEDVFGDSHYGDDLGDFAYVWRNRYDPAARTVRFLITLFTRDGAQYRKGEEEHLQQWYTHEEITSAARKAGFTVESVTDDYTNRPATPDTLRETWTLRRAGGG